MLVSWLLEGEDNPIVSILSKGGVFSVERVLSMENQQLIDLSAFRWNDQDVVFLKHFLSKRCSDQSDPPASLEQLFDHHRYFTHTLSSGSPVLDGLIGGIRTEQLVELSGESSTGKSELCMSACADAVLNHRVKVLYIDSGGNFDYKRFYEILVSKLQFDSIHTSIENKAKKVMAMVSVAQASDIQSLSVVMAQTCDIIESDSSEHPFRLVVVDSLTPLLSPLVGTGGKHSKAGYAVLSRTAMALRRLAVKFGIAVLYTNSTVRDTMSPFFIMKPSLGLSWISVPDVRILLSRHEESKVIAQLIKSRNQSLPEPSQFLTLEVLPRVIKM